MGKHLWRKNSYGRVEKEDPGCVWTVFRLMNYHPWHNVKKMLPYINQKPHNKRSSRVTNEQTDFGNLKELEEDAMTNYSASVHSSPSRNGSGSRKRSIKARIKALIVEKHKSGKVNTIEEHELLALEAACNDLGAPTLISLLKSNPKILTTLNPVNERTNLSRATSIKRKESKEEYVGVLELFKVDQEMFLKIVQDSPPKKHRLTKSGSFPFSNKPPLHPSTFGTTPSKLEHKHNEIWPIPTQIRHELRKVKSHNMARSFSLKESLDKYGLLIDATAASPNNNNNNNNNRGFLNKTLSKSLKLSTEKEFVTTLGDQHGRKSFRERMFRSEAPRASLDCFLQNMSQVDEVRMLRLESPPSEISGLDDRNGFSASGVDQEHSIQQVEIEELIEDYSNCMRNEGASSILELDVDSRQDQIQSVDWPILEDSPMVSERTSAYEILDEIQWPEPYTGDIGSKEMAYCDENLQYVKYVLDIIGFKTTNDQLEAWHSPDQPLDPALFDGIEIICPFEPKPSSSSKKEVVISSSDRKVLFDLINEALFDIHENSYAYYPKPLTYGCIIYPEPKGGSRVVEQVWEFASECLEWQPEYDVDLNIAVGHNLNRRKSGWTNLQTEIELVGIDLADWIFSELLDKFVCGLVV